MGFWGVEVKPENPVAHSCRKGERRVRITQATLGVGNSAEKSLLQCTVGGKSPIYVCALLPNNVESCHMGLEFEEADDVIFSVIGSRSLHLTGHYVNHNQRSYPKTDTEPHVIDTENTKSEKSIQNNEDDKHEDGVIGDAELPVPVPSPISCSRGKKCKLLKKKNQVIDSDDDPKSWDSNDEDDYQLSMFNIEKPVNTILTTKEGTTTKINVEIHHKSEDGSADGCELAEEDCEQERFTKSEDQKMDAPLEGEIACKEDAVLDCKTLEDEALQNDGKQHLPIYNNKDQLQDQQSGPEPSKSAKRKWKDKIEDDKKVAVENVNCSFTGEAKTDTVEVMPEKIQLKPSIDVENNNGVLLLLGEASSENDRESKKIRKEVILKRTFAESDAINANNTPVDRIMEEQDFQSSEGIENDLPVEALNHEEAVVDVNTNIMPDLLPNDCPPNKRSSKKRNSKKKNDQEDVSEMPLEVKNLSTGLVIQEFAKGDPSGKLAVRGKKIKVHFTGMLKENGRIIETTVGKLPCQVLLGGDEMIDGFQVGVEGMRVGDRRRLIIPPSMGFGEHGHGEDVPPNSWLVYEVELLGVRC